MEIRENLKYTRQHKWILIDENIITFGITDYAQDVYGDILCVDLLDVGTAVKDEDDVNIFHLMSGG